MKDPNKSTIFKEAWKMARHAYKEFGGKIQDYLSDALKRSWSSYKLNDENEVYFTTCIDYINNKIAFWNQGGWGGVTAYNNAIINAYEKMYEILFNFKKDHPLNYNMFIKLHQKEILRVLTELDEWQVQYHHLSDVGGVVEEFYEIFYGVFNKDKATPEEVARHDYYVQVDNELSAESTELLDSFGIS